MFNLFKKAKAAFEPKVNTVAVIEAIHNEFDSSTDRLLKEAKEILSRDVSTAKGEELSKLGFVRSKAWVETREIIATKKEKEAVAKHIQYYQQHYPFNKFITEEEVERICKKYGLLCGEAEYYTGDVPDKNVKEISSFKLRDDECTKHRCGWFKYESMSNYRHYVPSNKQEGKYGYVTSSRWGCEIRLVADETQDFHYEKQTFKICASVKDFDMNDMIVTDGYKLDKNIHDPIVLQPVNGGYLIVSKWGLPEGANEELVNEINN